MLWFCVQWVSDGSPTHSSTPVKIDGALQFVPKNTNPKEFKQIQQQVSVGNYISIILYCLFVFAFLLHQQIYINGNIQRWIFAFTFLTD